MKLTLACALAVALTAALAGSAQESTTYTDQVLPLIENHCGKCHNPDKKKGDLDLTTYAGVLKGGGSGAVVVAGNPDASKLWKAITQVEEPTMPPNKPPLPEKELEIFKKWIASGLLETSGSKALAPTKPSLELALKTSAIDKPRGPPPMPGELPLDVVVHTPRGNAINGLAASPWAPLAAIAGQKQILLYHTTSLELLGILPFDEGQPWDLKFSRSGQLLLAGGGHAAKSGKVVLWNVETGERIASLGNEYDTVLAADISPDQTRVALGGPDRLIKIYSTKSRELEHKIKKHTDWITALAFSPNGEFLASGDRNGGVSLWDPDNGQELFTTAGHKGAVTAVAWRGDSRVVASSSEDGSVKLWEASEGKLAKTWVAHSAGTLCLAYGHDGKLLTCGRDGTVTSWSADGSKLRSFEFGGDPALRCAFTHDGGRVIAADFAGRVAAWDAKDGKCAGQLEANPLPLAERLEAARHRLQEIPGNGELTATRDPKADLTAAETLVNRLLLAQSLSTLRRTSESVTALKLEVDRRQALRDAKEEEIQKLTAALGAAKHSAAKSKLKAALKIAIANGKSADLEWQRAAAELGTAQADLEQRRREHNQRSAAFTRL